jgi:hypothetical protein
LRSHYFIGKNLKNKSLNSFDKDQNAGGCSSYDEEKGERWIGFCSCSFGCVEMIYFANFAIDNF